MSFVAPLSKRLKQPLLFTSEHARTGKCSHWRNTPLLTALRSAERHLKKHLESPGLVLGSTTDPSAVPASSPKRSLKKVKVETSVKQGTESE